MARTVIILKKRIYFLICVVALLLSLFTFMASKGPRKFNIEKAILKHENMMQKMRENANVGSQKIKPVLVHVSQPDKPKDEKDVNSATKSTQKFNSESAKEDAKPVAKSDGKEPGKKDIKPSSNDAEKQSKKVSKPLSQDQDLELFNGPEIMETSEETDWKRLGEKLRVFKKLHELKYNDKPLSSEQSSLYDKAEKYLFSWIKPSFSSTIEMRNSFKGDGIVVCVGNGQFKMALATLKMIRNVHFSKLPIEVFYMGDDDLSAENRKVMESLTGVKTRDITKLFDDKQLKLGGWAIKTYAMLASTFQNVMLIDADVVFLQSPDVLFASRLFGKYAALFFHDRSLYAHGDPTKNWFKDLMPQRSEYSKKLRVFQDKTGHEQESGVVLINKKVNTPALLASCILNAGDIRDRTYKFVYGDKETFWVGFETVGSSYRFNGFYPGTIGTVEKKDDGYEICSRQILHVDEHQVPTWINGGILESKYDENTSVVNLKSYIMEPGEWNLKDGNMACLVSKQEITLPKIYSDITVESGKILLETLGKISKANPKTKQEDEQKDESIKEDLELFKGPEIMETSKEIDWPKLGEKLRLFKTLHDLKYNNQPLSAAQSSLYEKAEKYLFSWIKPSFSTTIEMRNSFKGEGIVVCVGNGQFKMALATLRMIRNVHFSKLPIEVFYMGDDDLSAENRKVMESLTDVKTRDITKLFDDKQLKLGGWAIKTFAMLASSFQNTMLIDADVVFLQSPDVLFASRLFGKYAALFFHDRSLYSHEDGTKKWFKDLMPRQSDYSKKLRVFHDKSAHEQESGVVLINKKVNTPALLASCILNAGDIRDRTYKFVYGDKETFWVGFETVGSSYRFNGFYPGTIGEAEKKDEGYEICARQLLHVDEHQVPTWINGGILESKYDEKTAVVKMDSYVMEPGEWTLKEGNLACLVSKQDISLPKVYSDITTESGKILLEALSR